MIETNLSDFIIKDGVLEKYIGTSKIVTIPYGVHTIGDNAFAIKGPFDEYFDSNSAFIPVDIEQVYIPETVIKIDSFAFSGCTNLKEITIPNGVRVIEEGAFHGSGLKRITIPSSVKKIASSAFEWCFALNDVTILNGVEVIGDYAFSFCSLKQLQLPPSIKRIGKGAFQNCANLKNITIPKSVAFIEANAFLECDNLVVYCKHEFQPNEWDISWCPSHIHVLWDYPKKTRDTENGIVFSTTQSNTIVIVKYIGRDSTLIIPEELEGKLVTEISSSAFKYCKSIENIILPDSITKIGHSAFLGCTNLKHIKLPEFLKVIETKTFEFCTNLKRITMSQSLRIIESSSFVFCRNLESIKLPESVHSIQEYAFYGCSNLKQLIATQNILFIANNNFETCDKLVIYGNKKTLLESYAINHNLPFKEIEK